MLIGFKVRNFRSFNDLQHFSMIASKVRNNSNHITLECNKKILKFSGIYGANGSGKSNLILAISLAQNIIVNGASSIINNQYFRGYKCKQKEDTYFEFELSLNNKLYSYGFEVNIFKQEIVSEWLIDMTKPKEKVIFERNIKKGEYFPSKTKNNYFNICLSEMKENKNELFILEMVRRIVMSKNDDPIFKDIIVVNNYLINDMYIIRPTSHKFLDIDYLKIKDKILKIFKELDINITDIITIPCDFSTFQNKLLPKDFSIIKARLDKEYLLNHNVRQTVRILNDLYVLEKNKTGEIRVSLINFIHENSTSNFGAYEESDGTLRILELIDILITKNKLFLIDELDNSLHPMLVKGLLKLFLESSSSNQLIITTHELKTFDFDLVRRDEIWFAEKNSNGESKLFSLEEFKDVARFDKKIDKAYLEGRFGAVPRINIYDED